MKKAAIYARVSSEDQTMGFSLDAQVEAIQDYCKSKGYEVAGEYVDAGYTGTNDQRPQLRRLIADAQDGIFEAVIVHKFDRFARNRAQSVIHKALLRDLGISVLSVMEPTDPDNPSSIITEGVLEVLGEWFSANLGSEVRKGRTKGAKLGKWMGGFIKFGYKVNDEGYNAIDETEAKHVLSIFQKAASGMPLRQIVLWLHNEGIPTKRPGGKWTAQRLSLLLKDEAYIGKAFFNKKRRKGGKLVEGEPVAVPFPAIVQEELCNRVRARLTENKKKNSGGTKRFYLLQHLGKCGECGGNLRCHTVGKHRYINCSRQHTYPHYDCYKPENWKMGEIEDFVWAEVEDILDNYRNATVDLLLERFENASNEREQQIDTAKQHLIDLKLEKQRILTTIRKGYVTEAEADVQFKAIKSEQDYWERELANLQALQADSEAAAEKFVAQLKQLDRLFDYGGIWYLTSEQKRQLLTTLLQEFILYRDGKIELRFKLPVNEEQVADTISNLSSNNVLYYRLTPNCPR
jgi:site-specific DNA recombinase